MARRRLRTEIDQTRRQANEGVMARRAKTWIGASYHNRTLSTLPPTAKQWRNGQHRGEALYEDVVFIVGT